MKKKLLFIFPIILLLTSILYIRVGSCNELDRCAKRLHSSNPQERIRGLSEFTSFDRKTCQENIELIIPLLYDEVEKVRVFAFLISGDIFLEPRMNGVLVIPPFKPPRLKKDDIYIKAAKLILPHLIEKLKSERELLQRNVLSSIAYIGMIDDNIDVIIEKLDSENDTVRFYALVALGNIGKESKKAISKIESMKTNDESNLIRKTAEQAWIIILQDQ